MSKLAGMVLIVGSLLFLVTAFIPINFRVVTASDPEQRAELIQNERSVWLLVNVLFGVASIASVVGLAMFALHVQGTDSSIGVRLISYLAPAVAAIGALFWVIIVYGRVVLPPQELTWYLTNNTWIFPAYTLLTQVASMIVGITLLRSSYPPGLGWGMVALAGLSLITFLVVKDMPPFTHYVPLLVMGITLVR